jgi:hypothetical protein
LALGVGPAVAVVDFAPAAALVVEAPVLPAGLPAAVADAAGALAFIFSISVNLVSTPNIACLRIDSSISLSLSLCFRFSISNMYCYTSL